MTIRPSRETFLDKVLKWFRRERQILPPLKMRDILKKFGPYVIVIGRRESFWKSLFRKRVNGKPGFKDNGL